MTKSDDPIQSVEYHGRIDHFIVVELSKILNLCNAFLVEFEVVQLEAQGDLFQDIVHNIDDKTLMISVQRTNEDRKEMNVAVFDLDRLAKDALQNINHLFEELVVRLSI